MNRILYSDLEGTYSLLDYSRSHSQLLFRKRTNCSNTDILFKSVRAIVLPTLLTGIEISRIENEKEIVNIIERYHFNIEFGYRIYLLKTKQLQEFYLNAGVFGVFQNELDILETSIGDFTWSKSNSLIFWSDSPLE